jgi:catalase
VKKPLNLAVVVVIVGITAVLFAYTGGWFSPGALTPARFTDGLQQASGVHSGFRRNHAKGVCVSGWFDSNGQGLTLSKATVFEQGRVPVIGRFSLGGGNPNQIDAATTVRGLGIRFMPSKSEEWRTAMVDLPVFPFATPEAFYDQLTALAPDPATGKPDPARAQAFFAKYPESAEAIKVIKSGSPSSGFDNSTFNSLNAFEFINASGDTALVRWSFVPAQPFAAISAAHPEGDETNYLFDALIAAVHQHSLQWRLIITIAQPGDPTDDATLPWPTGRKQVDVGTLTINQVESDDTSVARNINFDPLVLPDGIAPSDDPLLSARSAVYSQSFTRREGEHKTPSPVSSAETEK